MADATLTASSDSKSTAAHPFLITDGRCRGEKFKIRFSGTITYNPEAELLIMHDNRAVILMVYAMCLYLALASNCEALNSTSGDRKQL